MDLEVSRANLQRETTNTAAVQLDVEETQLTGDLVHKRQVMGRQGGGGFNPPPAVSSSLVGRGAAFRVRCCSSLHPPPITSPSICSVYSVSPYTPVCPGTAARSLLPTVFPSAAFSSELPIPNFPKCRRFTRRRGGEGAEGVGAFGEFRATRCDGSRSLVARAPLHVRRVSFRRPSLAKMGNKGKNVLNMRPPRNKYVHRINMRVPAGVSVQPEFKKSRLYTHLGYVSHRMK